MNFCRYLWIFLLVINYSIYSQSIDSNFTLVIDPGHGGKDPGNTGNGYLEKKIALSIGLKIGERLKKYKNISVIYFFFVKSNPTLIIECDPTKLNE